MLYMRPFQPRDAGAILSWCRDEKAFRQWSADRYETYPAAEKDMLHLYDGAADFFPMTMLDENGPAGHITLRYPSERRDVLRLGFVIVDDARRGQGYGKALLSMALHYAFGVARVQKVTLGVFENNQAAYRCYKAAGFRDVELEETECYHVLGETWRCREMQLDVDEWRQQGWN